MLSLASSLRLRIDFFGLQPASLGRLQRNRQASGALGKALYSQVSVGQESGQLDGMDMPGDSGSIAGAGYCVRVAERGVSAGGQGQLYGESSRGAAALSTI